MPPLPPRHIVQATDGRLAVRREHARIVKRHGAAVVVMAFDEEGQAATCEEKVRAYMVYVIPYIIPSLEPTLAAAWHVYKAVHLPLKPGTILDVHA